MGEDRRGTTTFLYVLATLAATHSVATSAAASDSSGSASAEALVRGVLSALSVVQQQGTSVASSESDAEIQVLDDDVSALLERLRQSIASDRADASTKEKIPSNDPLEGLMKSLENSKIADMASEISRELDLSAMSQSDNPMDFLGLDKLADGNSVLGSIVSKVGSKIQGKLASGELKQEELLSEAVGFLKAFEGAGGPGGGGGLGGLASMLGGLGGLGGGKGGGGNGGFDMSDVMKMAKAFQQGSGGGPKQPPPAPASSGGTRDRLRDKLARREKDKV